MLLAYLILLMDHTLPDFAVNLPEFAYIGRTGFGENAGTYVSLSTSRRHHTLNSVDYTYLVNFAYDFPERARSRTGVVIIKLRGNGLTVTRFDQIEWENIFFIYFSP